MNKTDTILVIIAASSFLGLAFAYFTMPEIFEAMETC